MTIREKLTQTLVERGMVEDQAKVVLEVAMQDKSLESMKQRWNEPVEGHPDVLMTALWVSVKDFALAWIDENLPKAWFRPLFEEAS